MSPSERRDRLLINLAKAVEDLLDLGIAEAGDDFDLSEPLVVEQRRIREDRFEIESWHRDGFGGDRA